MFQNMVMQRVECSVNQSKIKVNQSINIHTVLYQSQTLHLSNSYHFHSSVLPAIQFLGYTPYRKEANDYLTSIICYSQKQLIWVAALP